VGRQSVELAALLGIEKAVFGLVDVVRPGERCSMFGAVTEVQEFEEAADGFGGILQVFQADEVFSGRLDVLQCD
jgi:hypothetical protein